jgi:hypothetical protein
MLKKLALFAVPALALFIGFSGVARAEVQCETSIKEVQAKWDKMYPMGMQKSYKNVEDNFRIAKEKCKDGKTTEVEQYLNVVRAHLNQPEHTAPHDRK